MFNKKSYSMSSALFGKKINEEAEPSRSDLQEFDEIILEFYNFLSKTNSFNIKNELGTGPISIDNIKHENYMNHPQNYAIYKAIKKFAKENSHLGHLKQLTIDDILNDHMHLNYDIPPGIMEDSIAEYLFKIFLVDHNILH